MGLVNRLESSLILDLMLLVPWPSSHSSPISAMVTVILPRIHSAFSLSYYFPFPRSFRGVFVYSTLFSLPSTQHHFEYQRTRSLSWYLAPSV